MDNDIDFTACDLPEANRLLLHVMAAVGEAEAKAIRDRTIAALAAAKASGVPLGAMNPKSRNLTRDAALRGAAAGAAATAAAAREFYADVQPIIKKLRGEGHSLAGVAQRLNDLGYRLRSGKPWTPVQVGRLLNRHNS
jgi:DNA invertase Pin-like site-specific DNA recombinase